VRTDRARGRRPSGTDEGPPKGGREGGDRGCCRGGREAGLRNGCT
jgi:hypothetical protein